MDSVFPRVKQKFAPNILTLSLLRHCALLGAALAVSICAVLVHAQEQTGLVLHLYFDVHEAAG